MFIVQILRICWQNCDLICAYSSDITVILTELRIKLNLWLLYYGYAENIIKLMVHIDKSTKGQRGTIRQTTADAVCSAGLVL